MDMQVDFSGPIVQYFANLQSVLCQLNQDEINASMNALLSAYDRSAAIYCFGNGGSASTASHMLNDFNKGISGELQKKFRVYCLNDNVPILTAIANDIGYSAVFSRQLEGKANSGDLIVAISGSGNSENILQAVTYAKSRGCKILGVTGYDGGKLWELADYHMHVPCHNMQIVEDIHLVLNHMMMSVFSDALKRDTGH